MGLQSLTEQVKKKINSLKNDESVYLPGGYMQLGKSDDKKNWNDAGDLLSNVGRSIPMIYEVKRDPEDSNNLIFRVFENSIEGHNLMKSKLGILSSCQNLNIPLGNVPVFQLDKANHHESILLRITKHPFKANLG